MELDKGLVDLANNYYDNIAVNDFSSFIISDFKNDVLLDLSPERADENKSRSKAFIAAVRDMQGNGLSGDDGIIAESLIDFAAYIERSNEHYWYKFNVTHNTCPLKYVIKRLESFPVNAASNDSLGRYVRIFGQMPGLIADMRAKFKRQIEMGFGMHPEETQISRAMFLSFKQGAKSLLNPQNRGIPLSAAIAGTIDGIISRMNDEIDKLIECLCATSRGFVSLSDVRGGADCYRGLIKTYTSYDLSPREIHEIGLRELEVTKEKMRDLIRGMGLDLSLEAFEQKTLADRRFFDDTPERLTARFGRYLEKIRPKLPLMFKHFPVADCCARALGKDSEGATSWGYYSVPIGTEEKGVFYFSAAELDKRSQIRTAAITYHELLPGHHFQVNLAKEDKSLPKISQNHFNTAFADGWAEYASDLAHELGMYDEYDLYGRYIWDAILCVRLVVDTGVNALGWSVDQMRRFMAENTVLIDSEIKTESLRYAVDMPGQALAYKMGSLKNHELRRMAQSGLKDRFDIKEYHDTVLRYGSIPLYLLQKNVESYICTN